MLMDLTRLRIGNLQLFVKNHHGSGGRGEVAEMAEEGLTTRISCIMRSTMRRISDRISRRHIIRPSATHERAAATASSLTTGAGAGPGTGVTGFVCLPGKRLLWRLQNHHKEQRITKMVKVTIVAVITSDTDSAKGSGGLVVVRL